MCWFKTFPVLYVEIGCTYTYNLDFPPGSTLICESFVFIREIFFYLYENKVNGLS